MARHCYKDVLPFTAMIAVECGTVGVNILFKAATSKGMSYYIFITYFNAIATLVILPLLFIFNRRAAVLQPLKFHLLSRICLIGLVGYLAKICKYKGIEYGSPTLASAVGNLLPAFTFILAVLFRMEKVALRSSTSQAKIMGTIVSVSGAIVVVVYKGPKVFSFSTWTVSSSSVLLQWPLESSQSTWVIGAVLLAVAHLLHSFSFIIQAQVMEIYPQGLTVAFLSNLCGTIVAMPVSLMAESNLSSWRLTTAVAVAAVLYSGVFLSFRSCVHVWGIHLKGPVYAAIFRPLSIAIAAFVSAIFLGDALHLGSVIGAVILSMGFYAVIWGKAKEEEKLDDDSPLSSLGHLSNDNVPLLQSHKMEDIEHKT